MNGMRVMSVILAQKALTHVRGILKHVINALCVWAIILLFIALP